MATKLHYQSKCAILRKMCKENGVNPENVYIKKYFGYVETVNVREKNADYCETEYKGKRYKVDYFSGCFNPYIFEIE